MFKTIRTMMKLYVLQRTREAAAEADAKRKKIEFAARVAKYKKIIKNYKYVHVMNNGLHSENLVRFLNRHFSMSEHCFIFPIMKPQTREKVNDIGNAFNAPLESINFDGVQKIIFHGLFTKPFIEFLFSHEEYLQKSYWFIWGGDLYCTDDDVMRYVKSRVRGVLTGFDKDVYKERFGENTFFDLTYPSALAWDMVEAQDRPADAPVHILVNNCTDTKTLDMLDQLSRFSDQNIRISTILSYVTVGQNDSKNMILEKGGALFGEKFTPVLDFMELDDYAKFLASVDIYISNQDRQQGNGNASFICSLGGKVFMKSNSSVYKLYNSLGIKYFDTNTIPDLSFDEFTAYDEETKKRTVQTIKNRMDENKKAEQWKKFFEWVPETDKNKAGKQ